jgi:hypothetical protein
MAVIGTTPASVTVPSGTAIILAGDGGFPTGWSSGSTVYLQGNSYTLTRMYCFQRIGVEVFISDAVVYNVTGGSQSDFGGDLPVFSILASVRRIISF